MRGQRRAAGPPKPRDVAAEVLRRVLEDDAFAAAALSAELDRHVQLDARDRALSTELVYGSLRAARYLDGHLGRLVERGIGSLDPLVHAHLWVAGYELGFLRTGAAHAAVSEAVSSLKAARGERVAGFANAVLRRLATALSSREVTVSQAFSQGAPRWLRRALDRALGEGEATAFLEAGPLPPPASLRVREGSRDAWLSRLREACPGAEIAPGKASPVCILVRGAGDLRRLPGVAEGALVSIEEGSQVVAQRVGAGPGERVFDACAGRGNKTLLLLDAVHPTGRVDAAELHGSKLERLREQASAALREVGETFEVDWSVGPGDVPLGAYDRVLVDAPCSGTGTLRRRPELLLRRVEQDIARLAELQRAIVTNAARAVRPGGLLVYAVCSVLHEELEGVVEGLPGFTLQDTERLAPHRTGTDGYAIARLTRDPA